MTDLSLAKNDISDQATDLRFKRKHRLIKITPETRLLIKKLKKLSAKLERAKGDVARARLIRQASSMQERLGELGIEVE